jgi:hypothetical protein
MPMRAVIAPLLFLMLLLLPDLVRADPPGCPTNLVGDTISRRSARVLPAATRNAAPRSAAELAEALAAGRNPADLRTQLLQSGVYENDVNRMIEEGSELFRRQVTQADPQLAWMVELTRGTNPRVALSDLRQASTSLRTLENPGYSTFMRGHAADIRARFLQTQGTYSARDLQLLTDRTQALEETYREVRRYEAYLNQSAATTAAGQFPVPPPSGLGRNITRYENTAIGDPRHYAGTGRWRSFEGQHVVPTGPGRRWTEVEVGPAETDGGRNAFRLLYSNDGLIYYTADHYQSPAQLVGRWR